MLQHHSYAHSLPLRYFTTSSHVFLHTRSQVQAQMRGHALEDTNPNATSLLITVNNPFFIGLQSFLRCTYCVLELFSFNASSTHMQNKQTQSHITEFSPGHTHIHTHTHTHTHTRSVSIICAPLSSSLLFFLSS